MKKMRHKKSGEIYTIISEAKDCTNSRDDLNVVVYEKDGHVFVREFYEFYEKFEEVKKITPPVLYEVYYQIQAEVNRAKTLHKNTDYTPADWLVALMSEVGEVADEIADMKESGEPMGDNYVTELIHVAAVCVRMIEDYQKS